MRAKLAGVGLGAIVLVALGAARAPAQDKAPTAISDIRQESTDRSTRLIVVCTGPLAYTYYSPDPLTLVVDIPEVDASKVPARINVGTREVESLRVTSLARADGRSLARLEVRLASLVPYQIYSKGRDLNLVFERPAGLAQRRPPVARAHGRRPRGAAGRDRSSCRISADRGPVPLTPSVAAAAPVPVAPREEPKPAAPEKSTRSAAKATQIVSVSQKETAGQLAVEVQADGHMKYQDFFLGNPDRLVVDFADVVAKAPVRTIEVNQAPVKKVRLGQFSASSPKVARLVLDLSARTPYRIQDDGDSVKILFGEGSEPAPAPLAAMRSAPGASRSGRRGGAAGRDGAGADHDPARARTGRPRHARPARAAARRAAERSIPPPGPSSTRARPSALTSRTATSRTSSASSRTSAASTSS